MERYILGFNSLLRSKYQERERESEMDNVKLAYPKQYDAVKEIVESYTNIIQIKEVVLEGTNLDGVISVKIGYVYSKMGNEETNVVSYSEGDYTTESFLVNEKGDIMELRS